jgi:hypothetical protein
MKNATQLNSNEITDSVLKYLENILNTNVFNEYETNQMRISLEFSQKKSAYLQKKYEETLT